MSEKDQAKRVEEERKRYDERRKELANEAPDADEVKSKAADDEVLTLRELEAINEPPARPHNDEADIGKRYEGSDYAPDAQPDLNAPAYVLAKQAKLAAEGKDDTRVGAYAPKTDEEEAAAKEAAAKKVAAKKAADNK